MAHKFIDGMQSRSYLNQDEIVIGDEAGEWSVAPKTPGPILVMDT